LTALEKFDFISPNVCISNFQCLSKIIDVRVKKEIVKLSTV